MNTRRKFLQAAAILPAASLIGRARAQAGKPVPIAFLGTSVRGLFQKQMEAFYSELSSLGWKVGTQLIVDEHGAEGHMARLQGLCDKIARNKPMLVLTTTLAGIDALRKTVPNTPIVSVNAGDPVAAGFAKSLAHPGGMVTGTINLGANLTAKHVELLVTTAPKVRRVGFLEDPTHLARARIKQSAQRAVAHTAWMHDSLKLRDSINSNLQSLNWPMIK